MTIKKSSYLTKLSKNFTQSKGEIHPLSQNSPLKLVAWLVSGKIYPQKECQKGRSNLPQTPEEQVLTQITNRPGERELAGVIESELISSLTI